METTEGEGRGRGRGRAACFASATATASIRRCRRKPMVQIQAARLIFRFSLLEKQGGATTVNHYDEASGSKGNRIRSLRNPREGLAPPSHDVRK